MDTGREHLLHDAQLIVKIIIMYIFTMKIKHFVQKKKIYIYNIYIIYLFETIVSKVWPSSSVFFNYKYNFSWGQYRVDIEKFFALTQPISQLALLKVFLKCYKFSNITRMKTLFKNHFTYRLNDKNI